MHSGATLNFNDRLGISASPDGRSVELLAGDEHLVAPDTVHFAVLATLAEVSAAQAVVRATGRSVVPVSVSVQLMSRARSGPLVARGQVLKAGRTLAFVDGDVFQGEKQVAKASVTFALT